ncbi:MAG: hypothetical protein CFH44_00741 [Proteobacteria bacterium]|nr:MAG: hypothetical protein CFH44_00741 [Pseudomonadota bacterium]
MLKKKSLETYYAISSRYDINQKKIITCIAETDGQDFFEFIASFEKIVDTEISSLMKKIKGYNFTASELRDLTDKFSLDIAQTITSILTENNLTFNDVDFICVENPSLGHDLTADISKFLFKKLQIPVICDLNTDNFSDYFKLIVKSKSLKQSLVINLDENFEIYKVNDAVSYLDSTLGYSILRFLSLYCNVSPEQVSYLISQGEVDQAIVNKLLKVDNLEQLQKDLINLIMLSQITTEDKLKTAFAVIKSLLLKNLAEFDKGTNIVLIGSTSLIEELNQSLKEIFENVYFVKNQSQRQLTLLNEQLAFLGAKKYAVENYNNGVKIS